MLHYKSQLLIYHPYQTQAQGKQGAHSVLITGASPGHDSFWQTLASLYTFLESMNEGTL